jgi:hypothetical protein
MRSDTMLPFVCMTLGFRAWFPQTVCGNPPPTVVQIGTAAKYSNRGVLSGPQHHSRDRLMCANDFSKPHCREFTPTCWMPVGVVVCSRRGHWFDPSIAHFQKPSSEALLALSRRSSLELLRSIVSESSADVIIIECLQDPVVIISAPGVEIQGRRGPLVAHHPLHHVDRHAVIDEPGGI